MASHDKVINLFSHNRVIEPHRLRRFVGDFIILFIATFAAVGLALFIILAEMPPSASALSWPEIMKGALKIVAYKATGGVLWSVQGREIIDGIASTEAGFWIELKAGAAALAAAGIAFVLNRKKLIAVRGHNHIRGLELHDGKNASKKLLERLPRGDELYIFPGVTVTPDALGSGMLCVGSAGSGKTLILSPLIDKIIKRNGKLITLDAKSGEQIRKYKNISFIAPWLRGSLIPDIGKDCYSETECFAFADTLIKSIPGKGEIWGKAASAIVGALALHLAQDKPHLWTWQDLADVLALPVARWIEIVAAVKPDLLSIINSGSDTTTGSVIFTIAAELKNLSQVAEMFAEGAKHGGKLFSVREWLLNPNYPIRQIVFCWEPAHREVAFLIPWLIDTIALQISSLEQGTRDRKYLILDEFAQLPKLNIDPYFAVGRSFGLQTIVACQDWAQVIDTYGRERSGAIFSNASVKVIAMITPSEGQKIIAGYIGEREVSSITTTYSTGGGGAVALNASHGAQEKTQSVVMAGQLGKDLKVIFKDKKPVSVRALLIPFGAGGDVYIIDFPAILFKEVRKAPRALPSQHPAFAIVKKALREPTSFAEQVSFAQEYAEKAHCALTDYGLASMLYSLGLISVESWTRARKSTENSKAVIEEIKAGRLKAEQAAATETVAGYPTGGSDKAREKMEDKEDKTPTGDETMTNEKGQSDFMSHARGIAASDIDKMIIASIEETIMGRKEPYREGEREFKAAIELAKNPAYGSEAVGHDDARSDEEREFKAAIELAKNPAYGSEAEDMSDEEHAEAMAKMNAEQDAAAPKPKPNRPKRRKQIEDAGRGA